MITIYKPDIYKYTSSAIKAINSGWISNHGEYIKKSNKKLREILKCKYTILMSNGTCSTHCLFLSLKFKYPNIKKIYIPNNCYVAAWNTLFYEYSKENIIVMKMDLETWNINTDENYIMSLDKNSAVLIVHNLGNIVNVIRLKNLRPDLIFVEDNCEGIFGQYEGIYSGTSDKTLCSSVSFYGNKIITTGEGGAFFTNDEEIYNYISKVYSQGLSTERYLHDTLAYNYRMTNVQAAFLFDQLNDIDFILTKKRKNFENYEKLLQPFIENGFIKLFKKENNTSSADWIFSIRIVNNKISKKNVYEFFIQNNIDTRPFFYPINSHDHLKDIPFEDNVPSILNNEILMIPSSPEISFEEQKLVVQTLDKFYFYTKTNLNIIDITENNKDLLKDFIPRIDSEFFKYFKTRNENAIKDHILTLLLQEDNKTIGYSHIDFDGEKYWFGIYLDENYRGKGIGNQIIEYITKQSVNEIHLSVYLEKFQAINLYQKNGFVEYSRNLNNIFMKINFC
jgi:perosamine synthetase